MLINININGLPSTCHLPANQCDYQMIRILHRYTHLKFKGYEEVIVQDISLKTDNVLFRKQKYYSP